MAALWFTRRSDFSFAHEKQLGKFGKTVILKDWELLERSKIEAERMWHSWDRKEMEGL